MASNSASVTARLVVLISGSGTNLAALLAACADPAYGAEVVAVGADRDGIEGLNRAAESGIATFVCKVGDFDTRDDWDAALTEQVASFAPGLVISAGFMKILGKRFLEAFTTINTHPSLLPAFPGAHAVEEALEYGVKVTGATLHLVDDGIDTGPILDQTVVQISADDTVESLHERIKQAERVMLVDAVGRLARENIAETKGFSGE